MIETAVIANKLYEKVNINERESLDEIAVKVIRNDCPDFLLPMRMVEIDGDIELRYEVAGGVALNLQNLSMDKKRTIELLINMMKAFEECPDYFLDIHKLYLDDAHIYLSKDCENVKYLYIPSDKYNNDDGSIINFFNKLIAHLDITDDKNYQFELMKNIAMDSNIHSLYEKLKKDLSSDTNIKNNVNNNPSPVAENKAQVSQPKQEPVQASKPVVSAIPEANKKEDDLVNALFGDDVSKKEKSKKKGGIFDIFSGKKHASSDSAIKHEAASKEPSPSPAVQSYTVPSSVSNSNMTIIEGDEPVGNGELYLELISDSGMNCPKRINIKFNNNKFIIGRADNNGNRNADFCFDTQLTSVSRRHCCFETDGNNVYLIDLDSTNHTYLNHNQLIPNNRYPVNREDVISLTNKTPISYRLR